MLLGTRDSYLGFPLLLERPLEGFLFIFSTSWLKAKSTYSFTALFLLKYNVVLLGVVVEGFHNTIPCLIFQRRESLFLEKVSKEGFKSDFHILASGQASPIINSAVPSLDCVVSVSTCSGGLHHHFGRQDIQCSD